MSFTMKNYDMKKFIVTGGCGFIGSHLVERLDQDGASVLVIDDLSSGYAENIKDCGSRVQLHVGTVEDFIFQGLGKIDCVFHLAAQASVPFSIDNLYTSSSSNLRSTLKVLDFCARENIPLVYASSSAVYGNLPLGIESADVDLLSPYAADKYVSEIYCSLAHKLYSMRSYGLRFFNVYGPRQDPTNPYSGVISIFVNRLLKGLPITVNGGYQTRDFIFVKDVVEGIHRAYEFLEDNCTASVSNVLTGDSISIDELVGILADILKVKPDCKYQSLPSGDPAISSGSIELMEANLALDPSGITAFPVGLARTVDWMRYRIGKD